MAFEPPIFSSHYLLLGEGMLMRYVIVIMCATLFLIWDVLYNEGHAIGSTVREVHRVVRLVTG